LLQRLRDEAGGGQARSATKLGLSESGYAIFGMLEQLHSVAGEDDSPNRDLAALIDEALAPFTKLVDWHNKDDVQREMRLSIKKILRVTALRDQADAVAKQLVALAKARRGA
jgi:type I restriction enzyme R subunit